MEINRRTVIERRPHIYKEKGVWRVREGFAAYWNDLAYDFVRKLNTGEIFCQQ